MYKSKHKCQMFPYMFQQTPTAFKCSQTFRATHLHAYERLPLPLGKMSLMGKGMNEFQKQSLFFWVQCKAALKSAGNLFVESFLWICRHRMNWTTFKSHIKLLTETTFVQKAAPHQLQGTEPFQQMDVHICNPGRWNASEPSEGAM